MLSKENFGRNFSLSSTFSSKPKELIFFDRRKQLWVNTVDRRIAAKLQKLFMRSCSSDLVSSSSIQLYISRKVVGKNVHATIPKGNMGYEQYTAPDTVAVEYTFASFLYHSQTYDHGLSFHSFKFLWRKVNSKPPTIPFGIVACTFSDNLSQTE